MDLLMGLLIALVLWLSVGFAAGVLSLLASTQTEAWNDPRFDFWTKVVYSIVVLLMCSIKGWTLIGIFGFYALKRQRAILIEALNIQLYLSLPGSSRG